MSEYTVEISKDARSDFISIHNYIKNNLSNPTAAKRFVKDTECAINSLESFPYSHMVRPGSKLFDGVDKRQYFYRKNYVIFYVILEDVKLVRVIKITYSPSDLDRD